MYFGTESDAKFSRRGYIASDDARALGIMAPDVTGSSV